METLVKTEFHAAYQAERQASFGQKKPKFKYLWAWDSMMGSTDGWKWLMQKRAEDAGAPPTAVWRTDSGQWYTFEEIKSEETKDAVARRVAELDS